MPKPTLVIVHLSSLDSYTDQEGEDAGWDLAQNIVGYVGGAVSDSHVIIVDQDWPLGPKPSEPREWVLSELADEDIIWMKFDEATQPWGPFLERLRKKLEDLGVERVIVGGVWYDVNLKSGCATEVYLYLKRFFKTEVDQLILGCE